jgi:hypothetical protein
MAKELICYRCGASLAELTPPISRQDECPVCSVYLHVCRMCACYDPNVPKQCTEDDAEEVVEKERLNFCDWYKPGSDVFDPQKAAEESRAKGELASLFGEEEAQKPGDNALLKDAEDLFK